VLLVSHDRALLDAVADRLLAVEDRAIASYPGGWADYVHAQAADAVAVAPAPAPKVKREKPKRPAKPKASALELVEGEVERAEARVAELEQKLAEDWGDMELLGAHKAAREDLEALLKRWESLFAEVSDSKSV
jgi:ATP-binding cassette subfamily F protein 3